MSAIYHNSEHNSLIMMDSGVEAIEQQAGWERGMCVIAKAAFSLL
jgi:hypothetical protein